MIGAEDFSLNIIHGEIMELRLSEVACLAAESLRSRVIIANTILAMQRHKARRGAVIIGWKHYGELQAFAQTLGIQGRMYSVPALVK